MHTAVNSVNENVMKQKKSTACVCVCDVTLRRMCSAETEATKIDKIRLKYEQLLALRDGKCTYVRNAQAHVVDLYLYQCARLY